MFPKLPAVFVQVLAIGALMPNAVNAHAGEMAHPDALARDMNLDNFVTIVRDTVSHGAVEARDSIAHNAADTVALVKDSVDDIVHDIKARMPKKSGSGGSSGGSSDDDDEGAATAALPAAGPVIALSALVAAGLIAA